ncbi:unnamed protein product, partial [Amoebophrya sp. A25]|eukprot:GSA25T00013563001.1
MSRSSGKQQWLTNQTLASSSGEERREGRKFIVEGPTKDVGDRDSVGTSCAGDGHPLSGYATGAD